MPKLWGRPRTIFSFDSYECQPSGLPCLSRPETYLAILPTCCLLRQRLKWPYASLELVQETLVRHHANFFQPSLAIYRCNWLVLYLVDYCGCLHQCVVRNIYVLNSCFGRKFVLVNITSRHLEDVLVILVGSWTISRSWRDRQSLSRCGKLGLDGSSVLTFRSPIRMMLAPWNASSVPSMVGQYWIFASGAQGR